MKPMTLILISFAAIVVLGLAYIRLAPSDVARWHVAPRVSADKTLQGGVKRLIKAGPGALQRLDAIARATPRTQVLAGSVDEGMITYVSRSVVFGFPDYTTVQQQDGMLRIFGRLRFGGSDFGVNQARVDGWLAALQAR